MIRKIDFKKVRSNRITFTLLTWVLIFLVIQVLIGCILQSGLAQEGAPTVNVALIETSNTADVGPDDTGESQFNGVVSVAMDQAKRVIVNLSAEDTWNSAIISPNTLEFSSNGDKQFVVKVYAALGSNFTEPGLLTVYGNWTGSPGNFSGKANPEQGAVGRIDINQFHNFSLSSPKTNFESTQGSQIVCTLVIYNLGNFMDTFSLDIKNYEELSKKNIEVVLTQSNIEILQKPANESLDIQVTIPNDAKIGEHDIKVKVVSDKGVREGIPEQVFTFKVKVTKGKGTSSSPSPIPSGFESVSVIFSLMIFIWISKRKRIFY
jgi:hypothetical protein